MSFLFSFFSLFCSYTTTFMEIKKYWNRNCCFSNNWLGTSHLSFDLGSKKSVLCLWSVHKLDDIVIDEPLLGLFVPIGVVQSTWAWVRNALMFDRFINLVCFVQFLNTIFSVSADGNDQLRCNYINRFFQIFTTNFLQHFLLIGLKSINLDKCILYKYCCSFHANPSNVWICIIYFTFSSAGVTFLPEPWKNANGHRLCTKQLRKNCSASPDISCINPQNRWPLCSDLSHSRPVTGRAAISCSGLPTEPLNFIQSLTAGI